MTSTSLAETYPLGNTESAKVLIVDDDVDLLKLISIRLKPMQFELKTVTSAEEALSLMSIWHPDLIVTDLQLPGLSGMELFEKIHARNPLLPIIVLTAHGTIPEAVEATQSGLSSYLTKPFDSDALIAQMQTALLSSGFTSQQRETKEEQWRHHIVSKSAVMETVFDQVQSLAPSDSLILIEGEPGSGKDDVARALHLCSKRASQSFTNVSCISMPPELLEVEIFGRVGSKTAESPEVTGVLQRAHNGTILISDFNEAKPHFLHRIMTALIEKKARPIDSDVVYPCDVRPLATTSLVDRYGQPHNTLWNLGEKLDVAVLSVPSLKDRREDIPLIVADCLAQLKDVPDLQFSSKALGALIAADWPGNVRQLVNVTKQCARFTKTKIISEALVQSRLSNQAHQIQPLSHAHRDFERNYLTDVLKLTNGNVTKAAEIARRNRTEFHRLLNKHKIVAKSFRQ